MKHLAILPLFLFICISCAKEPEPEVCDDPLCNEYFAVWENLLKSRNGMSDMYFQEHITPLKVSLVQAGEVDLLRVAYKVKIGWAADEVEDQFTIRVAASNEHFPSLDISRGEFLTEEEINQVVDAFAFSSSMMTIYPVEKLHFSSRAKAMKELRKHADGCWLQPWEVHLKQPRFIDSGNGHMFLEAGCTMPFEDNECLEGEIDLVNGEAVVRTAPCRIN